MQNAHLRLGRLQYTRNTEKTNTQISVMLTTTSAMANKPIFSVCFEAMQK